MQRNPPGTLPRHDPVNGYYQGAGREGLEQRTGVHGLGLAGVGDVVDVEELLGAEVEGADQLAGDEAPVTGGYRHWDNASTGHDVSLPGQCGRCAGDCPLFGCKSTSVIIAMNRFAQ